jgi:hypothetical protein
MGVCGFALGGAWPSAPNGVQRLKVRADRIIDLLRIFFPFDDRTSFILGLAREIFRVPVV